MSDWINIESKFDNSKCVTCGNIVEQGSRVLWCKGLGIRHEPSCEDTVGIQEDNTAPLTVEWVDNKTYTYKELQTIINCQCCGTSLKGKDVWISNDQKTCEVCHV